MEICKLHFGVNNEYIELLIKYFKAQIKCMISQFNRREIRGLKKDIKVKKIRKVSVIK